MIPPGGIDQNTKNPDLPDEESSDDDESDCGSTIFSLVWFLIPAALHSVLKVDAAEEHFEGLGFEVEFGF